MKSQPSSSLRKDTLSRVKRVVIKVGSQLLAESPAGRPAMIADDLAALEEHELEVVVVSSGAIALGGRVLGLDVGQRPCPPCKRQPP